MLFIGVSFPYRIHFQASVGVCYIASGFCGGFPLILADLTSYMMQTNVLYRISPFSWWMLTTATITTMIKAGEGLAPFSREELSFVELMSKPYFVDKSELLKVFFEGPQFNFVSCPRRFGRTVNLQMIKLFSEIEPDSEDKPKHYTNTSTYAMLKHLKIFQNTSFVEEHMCKYAVLVVDLKYNNSISNFTNEVVLRFINDKLYASFEKYFWLTNVTKEVLAKRGVREEDIKYLERVKRKKVVERDLLCSLKRVARIVRAYYGVKFILLVDNYDNVMVNGISRLRYDIENFYVQMGEVMSGIFKNADDLTHKALVLSTSRIVLGVRNLDFKFVEQNLFLENHRFSRYFGFILSEVEDLANKVHKDDVAGKSKMIDYYKGYVTSDKQVFLFNPYSIARYCEKVPPVEPANYWIQTQNGTDDLFVALFKYLEFRELVKLFNTKEVFSFEIVDKCTQVDFSHFLGLYENKDERLTRYDLKMFMTFLLDEGYVGFAFDKKAYYKWPNMEIRTAMKEALEKIEAQSKD